jgi:hypothetical protein
MPRRRNEAPPPKYSFITVESKGSDVSWLKVHSGSVRRHAAYWGGPSKSQREDEKNREKRQGDTFAIMPDTDEAEVAAGRPSSIKYCITFPDGQERGKSLRESASLNKTSQFGRPSMRVLYNPMHLRRQERS